MGEARSPGTSDAGNNPTSFTSRRAYDLLSEGFGPGTNGPILVGLIIDNPDADTIAKVGALPEVLKSEAGVQQVSPVRFFVPIGVLVDIEFSLQMRIHPKDMPRPVNHILV